MTTIQDKTTRIQSDKTRRGFVKTTPALKEAVAELVENNPTISAGQLVLRLRRLGLSPLPSERQLARLKKQFLLDRPENRMAYRYLAWPESIGTAEIPWEASPVMLELLRFFRSKGWGSPTMRLAKWFWRITLAAPKASLNDRWNSASDCALIEAGEASFEGVQAWLTVAPWETKKSSAAYQKAIRSGEVPQRRPAGIKTSAGHLIEFINQFRKEPKR